MSLDIWTKTVDKNITHNLVEMWDEAGIYDALYMSEGKTAASILPTLRSGLAKLRANPEYYTKFNSPNGWGLYENAVPWLEDLILGLEKSPRAIVHICK